MAARHVNEKALFIARIFTLTNGQVVHQKKKKLKSRVYLLIGMIKLDN